MTTRDAAGEAGRLLDEIVTDFVQRSTMTEIPSGDPRVRSFILDRPDVDLVLDDSDDS